MQFDRRRANQSAIILADEPVGAVCERSVPKVIPRDDTNNPRVNNSPDTMTARIKSQYEKLNRVREEMLDGFLEMNPKDFIKRIAKTKPEAALAFIGRLLPRDMDVIPDSRERMPIIIIQSAGNAQVNVEN